MQAPAPAAAPQAEVFYCDPCEKEFKIESQYKAHLAVSAQPRCCPRRANLCSHQLRLCDLSLSLEGGDSIAKPDARSARQKHARALPWRTRRDTLQTHVKCAFPGCAFSASQRVVKEHVASAHSEGQEDGGPLKSLDTPEEIAKWREARRKNWPSASNMKRKLEEAQDAASRGDARVVPGRARRGPAWSIEPGESGGGGAGRGKSGPPRQSPGGKGEGKGCDTQAGENEEAPAPMIEKGLANGLFSCYDSSADEDEGGKAPGAVG